jgi:hypothetical protein
LDVEIEFIDDGTASERWDKIFELVETDNEDIHDSERRTPRQLSLF